MSTKASFLIHKDSLNVLDELTNEEAGKLLKAIQSFHCGIDLELDTLTKITFAPFKAQFIRDNEKYDKTCAARADSGSKGGLAKASKSYQKLANGSKTKQSVAKLAESDKDSDRDKESESESESDIKEAINDSFNKFWVAGMTKQNKQGALKSFIKQYKESKQEIDVFTGYLINDVQKRVAANVFGFDKMHPTTYLNQQRWHDDIVKPAQDPAKFDQSIDVLQNMQLEPQQQNGLLTHD